MKICRSKSRETVRVLFTLAFLLMSTVSIYGQKQVINRNQRKASITSQAKLNSAERKVVGKHKLSLQWISWEDFGTATITKTGNKKYYCKGSQYSKENSDYLKIEGTLTIVSEKHLVLKGFIETRVYHLNNGEACHREGNFDFVQSGKRRYWRMQQMGNCDGYTDYVDIYFK